MSKSLLSITIFLMLQLFCSNVFSEPNSSDDPNNEGGGISGSRAGNAISVEKTKEKIKELDAAIKAAAETVANSASMNKLYLQRANEFQAVIESYLVAASSCEVEEKEFVKSNGNSNLTESQNKILEECLANVKELTIDYKNADQTIENLKNESDKLQEMASNAKIDADGKEKIRAVYERMATFYKSGI